MTGSGPLRTKVRIGLEGAAAARPAPLVAGRRELAKEERRRERSGGLCWDW